MKKTTSSNDPPPPPPPPPRLSRKKDEVAKNFHLLDFGDRGRGISGGLTLSLSRIIVRIFFPLATLKIFTLAVATPLANNVYWTSSRIFENIPQNGPEYLHRNLAIARFLVTAVRKNIGGFLSWLVSLSSSVPELTRHGLERGLHVNP